MGGRASCYTLSPSTEWWNSPARLPNQLQLSSGLTRGCPLRACAAVGEGATFLPCAPAVRPSRQYILNHITHCNCFLLKHTLVKLHFYCSLISHVHSAYPLEIKSTSLQAKAHAQFIYLLQFTMHMDIDST